MTTQKHTDLISLHTRLHQCIRQLDTAKKLSSTSPRKIYLVDADEKEQEKNSEEIILHFSQQGTPFPKRRIMQGSISFSTTDYKRGNYGNRRGSYIGHRPANRRVYFTPTKNSAERSGRTMLCSSCNVWFYLITNCPKKTRGRLSFGETATGNTETEYLYNFTTLYHN